MATVLKAESEFEKDSQLDLEEVEKTMRFESAHFRRNIANRNTPHSAEVGEAFQTISEMEYANRKAKSKLSSVYDSGGWPERSPRQRMAALVLKDKEVFSLLNAVLDTLSLSIFLVNEEDEVVRLFREGVKKLGFVVIDADDCSFELNQIVREFRAADRSLPVLVASFRPRSEVLKDLPSRYVYSFIPKPLTPLAMLRQVESLESMGLLET